MKNEFGKAPAWFAQEMTKLTSFFNAKNLNDSSLAVWWDLCAKFDDSIVKQSVDHAIHNLKTKPTPNDFSQILRRLHAEATKVSEAMRTNKIEPKESSIEASLRLDQVKRYTKFVESHQTAQDLANFWAKIVNREGVMELRRMSRYDMPNFLVWVMLEEKLCV